MLASHRHPFPPAYAAGVLVLLSLSPHARAEEACTLLADRRLAAPVKAIAAEYRHRAGAEVRVRLQSPADVRSAVRDRKAACDVVVCMAAGKDGKDPLAAVTGARKVAWKHPTGEPVWAAALSQHAHAAALVRFLGGPTGHRLWAESPPGFRIASGKTPAEAYEWVVEHRTKQTYPMTAQRILAELGGIRKGVCIDIGCGSGLLDVEIAKRSGFRIIGLDIDPNVRPAFERNVRQAGLSERISFVRGDAQKLPFADNSADAVISRGTLTFIPDKARCLREVRRVLKPTGVAFLGGRYVFTPQPYRTSADQLREVVRQAGIEGARVIDARGQWVKIAGPQAPPAAGRFQGGPHMLAGRLVADYGITEGRCLLICRGDGGLEQTLQNGLLDITRLAITAVYPQEKLAAGARERIAKAGHGARITVKVGTIDVLPAKAGTIDLVAGVGPVLVFHKDKVRAMREVHRVLADGGAALIGGRFLHMPAQRKVPSEALRKIAAGTHLPGIRVIDDMGQWVEFRKGTRDRGFRD